jgi:hypothetical protein
MKELIEKIFTVSSSLIILGVLVIALTSKATYESTYGLWYFYSTIILLSAWIVAMAGLFFKKYWSYISAIVILFTHQVTLVVSGAWQPDKLLLILIPSLLICWFRSSKNFKKSSKTTPKSHTL